MTVWGLRIALIINRVSRIIVSLLPYIIYIITEPSVIPSLASLTALTAEYTRVLCNLALPAAAHLTQAIDSESSRKKEWCEVLLKLLKELHRVDLSTVLELLLNVDCGDGLE